MNIRSEEYEIPEVDSAQRWFLNSLQVQLQPRPAIFSFHIRESGNNYIEQLPPSEKLLSAPLLFVLSNRNL
ncbi:hypothetical protein PFISCL1PPCAC_19713, partial [Pristionchus fissidentatus]